MTSYSGVNQLEGRKVKQKNKFSDFRTEKFKLFLQDRFYPDVEFYGWKNIGKQLSNRYNIII